MTQYLDPSNLLNKLQNWIKRTGAELALGSGVDKSSLPSAFNATNISYQAHSCRWSLTHVHCLSGLRRGMLSADAAGIEVVVVILCKIRHPCCWECMLLISLLFSCVCACARERK